MASSTSVVPNRTTSTGGGFFGRFKTGLKLSKDSLAVIRDHPKLVVFPTLGMIATFIFWFVFLVPLWIAGMFGTGIEMVVLFLLYFLSTFAATFFTASLVFAVNQAFHGEEPMLGESMQAAWRRKTPILVWSAIAATVSVILKKANESNNTLARIATSMFAVGWTVLTFFIVPVIVFEDVTVKSMFTRSGQTFRDTWGESLGIGLGVTLLQFVIGIAGLVAALALAAIFWMLTPALGILIGIFLVAGVLIGTYLIGQTIWGITKTALYVYAAEERVPKQFENFNFETLDGRAAKSATPGSVENPPLHLNNR